MLLSPKFQVLVCFALLALGCSDEDPSCPVGYQCIAADASASSLTMDAAEHESASSTRDATSEQDDAQAALDAELAEAGNTSSPDAMLADAAVPDSALPDGDLEAGTCQGRPVDIIWAIDNSGSMGPHILALANNLTAFLRDLSASGADAHVTVLTAGAAQQFAAHASDPKVHLLDVDIQSTDALRKLLEHFQKYSGWLRGGVRTDITVSTDDGSDMTAAEFRTQMELKLGHPFTFHAHIADFAAGCGSLGTRPPTVYKTLAQDTGGATLLLCDDLVSANTSLAKAVLKDVPGCH